MTDEPIDFKVSKDDRNKQRRFKNRFLKKKAGYVSSSPEPAQSVIDVADSSDDSYYRRAKESNWSRYDEDPITDLIENEQMNAADFEFLQENPTRSSHFTFSSEKEWENDSTAMKTMNLSYFNLNLSVLNAALQTIPFYKRMDYGELNFSKQQIKEMDGAAEKAEIVYKNLLKDAEDEIMKKMQENNSSGSRKSSAKSKREKKTKSNNSTEIVEQTVKSDDINAVKDDKDDELDKLLNMTESDLSKVNLDEKHLEAPAAADEASAVVEGDVKTNSGTIIEKGSGAEPESDNKDIQQWLDGILDD